MRIEVIYILWMWYIYIYKSRVGGREMKKEQGSMSEYVEIR